MQLDFEVEVGIEGYSKSARARGGARAWHRIMCEHLFVEVLEARK